MGESTVKTSHQNPLDSTGEAGPPGPLGCQTAFPGPATPKLIRNRPLEFAPLGGGVQKRCVSQVLLAKGVGVTFGSLLPAPCPSQRKVRPASGKPRAQAPCE